MTDYAAQLAAPYRDARDRLAALTSGLEPAAFNRKPAAGAWSAGECVVHLNKMAERYLPVLEAAAGRDEPRGAAPFRYGWLGRRFARAVRPGGRPTSTMRAMKPPAAAGRQSSVDLEGAVARFRADTARYLAVVEAADGLDLARVKVRSPFLPVLRLPLGVFLEALGQHSLRHVLQAERAVADTG